MHIDVCAVCLLQRHAHAQVQTKRAEYGSFPSMSRTSLGLKVTHNEKIKLNTHAQNTNVLLSNCFIK